MSTDRSKFKLLIGRINEKVLFETFSIPENFHKRLLAFQIIKIKNYLESHW
jgi:hypothetical protein